MPKAESKLRVADEHDDDGVHKERTDWEKKINQRSKTEILGIKKMRVDLKKNQQTD